MVLVVLLLLLVVVADGVYFVLSCFRACNHFECTKLKSIRIHCPIPIFLIGTVIRTVHLSKTKLGTFCEKIRKNIKGPALKTLRHGIELIELYYYAPRDYPTKILTALGSNQIYF